MIVLTNDAGLSLDLLPEQRLVTEQNVAWRSDEELPGEFSYPIDAPLNENNRRFVAQGYRPDNAVPKTELPVTVQLDGVLYRRCTFAFRINSGKLSGFLKIDSSEFYDRIRNLSLLDALNVPFYLGDGLQSGTGVLLADRMKQLAALPPGQFPCTFFPLRNEGMLEAGFDESKLPGLVRNAYVNAWEKLPGGGAGFPVDLPNMPKFGYLICPQFYLSYVLEQIITRLAGYRIESDWLASPAIQALTIVNLTALRNTPADLAEVFTGHSLTAGLFLPDMSVGDFLKAIKSRFGLVFTYNANERVCRITQFMGALRKGATLDLTAFQNGPYSTLDRDNAGFTVQDFVDEGDDLYRDAQGKIITAPTQVTGKGQQPVTLKVGTCQLSYEKSPLSENASWFVPTVRQAGNVLDPAYKTSERYLNQEGKRPNTIGLKLLSYRGMTQDSAGNAYPLGTPDVRDGRQVAVGSDALTLSGRNGAWRNYLRAYYYFRDRTQPITQPLLLPVSVLASLRLDCTVQLSLDDYIRRSFLISKIQAEAPGIDGRAIVQLEVLSLPSGIELAPDVDEPLVWVELLQVLSDIKPIGPYPPTLIRTLTLTVKCWQNAARSAPSIVTNLSINLRFKQTWFNNVNPYQETILTYQANGAQTVLETALLVSSDQVRDNHPYSWTAVVSLDPGYGYNILT